MDDNPPHPPDFTREKEANTTGQGTTEHTLSAETLATLAATGIAVQGRLQQPRPTITRTSDRPREPEPDPTPYKEAPTTRIIRMPTMI